MMWAQAGVATQYEATSCAIGANARSTYRQLGKRDVAKELPPLRQRAAIVEAPSFEAFPERRIACRSQTVSSAGCSTPQARFSELEEE